MEALGDRQNGHLHGDENDLGFVRRTSAMVESSGTLPRFLPEHSPLLLRAAGRASRFREFALALVLPGRNANRDDSA